MNCLVRWKFVWFQNMLFEQLIKYIFRIYRDKNGYPTNAIKSETADSGIIEIEDTIESCCLFMKSVYLRQGLHGIIECTLGSTRRRLWKKWKDC